MLLAWSTHKQSFLFCSVLRGLLHEAIWKLVCLLVHAQAVRRREKVFQHSVPSLCDVGVERDKQLWPRKDEPPRRGTTTRDHEA